ncbi:MAG: trypsin-like peptidase domain-containing protein [candidate division Zixibacteria bacterium]
MKRILAVTILVFAIWGMTFADDGSLEIFDKLKSLIISVSDSLKPSVVHIEVIKKSNDQRYESLGSGLIIDPQGFILTNEHVIDNYIEVTVTLESNLEYRAEVIGADKLTDLALIKITAPEDIDLKVAELGNSDSVQVGEWVIAVGNPYGFDRSVSFGIVSGKGRVLNVPSLTPLLNDFIQTDAAIAPGSSGGPLVNLRGQVIGINSRGLGRTQGFTIPINIAIEVKDKLLSTGKIERGWLGIVTQPVNRSYARYLGNPDLEGILIADVLENSPAMKAGLRPGDVLLEFGDNELSAEKNEDLNKFTLAVSQAVAGEKKKIKLYRDGKIKSIDAKIGEKPKVKPDEFESDLGFTAKEVTEDMYRTYLLESRDGVYVSYVEVGNVASKADLMEGDVIAEVNRKTIIDFESFTAIMKNLDKDENFILFNVTRGKSNRYVLLDKTSVPKEDEKMSNGD